MKPCRGSACDNGNKSASHPETALSIYTDIPTRSHRHTDTQPQTYQTLFGERLTHNLDTFQLCLPTLRRLHHRQRAVQVAAVLLPMMGVGGGGGGGGGGAVGFESKVGEVKKEARMDGRNCPWPQESRSQTGLTLTDHVTSSPLSESMKLSSQDKIISFS